MPSPPPSTTERSSDESAAEGGDTQIVILVKEINANAPADALENNDEQIKELAQNPSQDLLNQMVGELQIEYGVSFNGRLPNN